MAEEVMDDVEKCMSADSVLATPVKLWRIIKALPFSGGPSATKWVYLAMNLVIAVVVLELTTAACIVYIRNHEHHIDGGMLTAIVTLVGIVQACATLALTTRSWMKAKTADTAQ